MSNVVLVTGGTGLVGTALQKIRPDWIYIGSKSHNLTKDMDVQSLFQTIRPDVVVHLAAMVGGVGANSAQNGDFFEQNILMNTNVLKAARRFGAKKVVSLLSTCIYPDQASGVQYPLTENQLHNGAPHHSNFGYAYAKRMLAVQSQAYNQQYPDGTRFLCAVPNNIYGENDSYNLETGHVVPSLIRKINAAWLNDGFKKAPLKLWGTGYEEREFTYSGDIARALAIMVEGTEFDDSHNPGEGIWNIGQTSEVVTIRELAQKIAHYLGCPNLEFEFVGDPNSSQIKKPSSNEKFLNATKRPFQYTSLDVGIKAACTWYVMNAPCGVRGYK